MDENQEMNPQAPEEDTDVLVLGGEFIKTSELDQLLLSEDSKDKEKLKSIVTEAATNDNYRVIIYLLDQRYQVDVLNDKNQTLTHLAFNSDSHSTLNLSEGLVFSNCENCRNYVDCNGLSHLHVACATGHIDVVRQFLDNGEDVLARLTADCNRAQNGSTPLHFAVAHHQREVVELLLERGADINAKDSLGSTPLHQTCAVSWEFKKFMNAESLSKRTSWAAELEILKLLIERDCDLNSKDDHGNTPLLSIFKNDYYYRPSRADKVVLENPLEKDELAKFLQKRQLEKFNILYEKGADITAKNYDDEIILHRVIEDLACMRFYSTSIVESSNDKACAEIIKSLLEANRGLDVNAKNKKAETPIVLAVSLMSFQIVIVLLHHNADPNGIIIDGRHFFRYPNVALSLDLVNSLQCILKCLLCEGFKLTLGQNLAIMKFMMHDVHDCDCGLLSHVEMKSTVFFQLMYYGSSAHMKRVIMKIRNSANETLKDDFFKYVRFHVEFCQLIPYPLCVDKDVLETLYDKAVDAEYESIMQECKNDVIVMKTAELRNGMSMYDFVTRYPNMADIILYCQNRNEIKKAYKMHTAALVSDGHMLKSMVRIYIESSALKNYVSLILPSLPDLCRKLILTHLDSEDIVRLCEAALLE